MLQAVAKNQRNATFILRDIKENGFFYSSALRSFAKRGACLEVKATLVGKRITRVAQRMMAILDPDQAGGASKRFLQTLPAVPQAYSASTD